MIKRIALILVLVVLVCPGCSPIGRDIKKSSVSGIERGVTTKAQVRQNLGEPQSVRTTSTGEVWSYRYMQGMNYGESWAALFGAREYGGTSKMLIVIFDGDRVKDYSYTESK
jgi:outer membrane protein assembly factor BamE (lipoprotein component of BamABCDE complex)